MLLVDVHQPAFSMVCYAVQSLINEVSWTHEH